MTRKKKILYIVQHRFNRSPGQRYRCEQYIPYLEQAGFECTYSPLIANKQEEDALYQSRSIFSKANIFLKGFWRRFKDVQRAKDYDLIFIYREAVLTGSTFFERMLKRSGTKVLLDFDDAIWLPSVSEVNRSLQWLKNPKKIDEIIGLSNKVMVGNTYLANYAKQFNTNVVIFPSTINLDYYRVPLNPSKIDDKVIIGWSGSHTTIEHFELILPVFEKLKAKYGNKVGFAVYGDPHYKHEKLGIQGIAWTPESEVPVIGSFDIGIMPLEDNDWSRGKCAMKGLQYMGLAVPAVLAAVGMNNDVIQDGVNGYLARTENEWLDKLSLLIENAELRKSIGAAGRQTIEQKFSCQAKSAEYVNIFLELTGQNP